KSNNACCPGATVKSAGEPVDGAREKSAPAPVSTTDGGWVAALVTSLSVAVRVPAALGVKETVMPQLAPAASDSPHWLCNKKSAAFGPDTETPLMLSVASPALLKVNDWWLLVLPTTWVGKFTLDGATEATGAPIPIPCTGKFCGLPGALSLITSTPFAWPLAVGTKDTLRTQFAPVARTEGQPFETLNPLLTVTFVIASGAPLGLLTVNVA